LDQVVLELVVAQSLSLSSKLGLEALEVVVALSLKLAWGHGSGQHGSQTVDQSLLGRQLVSIEDQVLNNEWVLLSSGHEIDWGQSVLQVEGKEVGGRSFVVALRDSLGQGNADLEAKLDAGEDLVLQWDELLLDVGRNVGAFEVSQEVGSSAWVGSHEGGDLVVEVLELALAEGQELQQNADFILIGILLLERTGLILELLDLTEKELSSFGSQVGLVGLELELGSLLDAVL
jgi:hypothetical protein